MTPQGRDEISCEKYEHLSGVVFPALDVLDAAQEEILIGFSKSGKRDIVFGLELAQKRLDAVELIGPPPIIKFPSAVQDIPEPIQKVPHVDDVLGVAPKELLSLQRWVDDQELLIDRRIQSVADFSQPKTELVDNRVDTAFDELEIQTFNRPRIAPEGHEAEDPTREPLPHEPYVSREVTHTLAVETLQLLRASRQRTALHEEFELLQSAAEGEEILAQLLDTPA